MTMTLKHPSYEDVIRYYLRDDVSEFFWKLSQVRQLKFFYHCDTDPSKSARGGSRAISIHCVSNIEELHKRIIAVSRPIPQYPYPFFPFWGIQSSRVNAPGEKDHVIGWDMRFEFDFDQQSSFSALLPAAAVFKQAGVPILLKYSGHRSLHLVVPAEAFPLSYKQQPDWKKWMEATENIGNLLCRIAPYMGKQEIGLSKETVLTTPYSFHRYHGLLSIPLGLKQAFRFDSEEAKLERFPGISWDFPDWRCEGTEMEALLDCAERIRKDPSLIFGWVEKSFKDGEWGEFLELNTSSEILSDSLLSILMAGVSSIGQEGVIRRYDFNTQQRLKQALLAMDEPESKTSQYGRLVSDFYQQSFAQAILGRKIKAEILSKWVSEGLDSVFSRIMEIASDRQFACPILLAIRLYSMLPEEPGRLVTKLLDKWNARERYDESKKLFLAIALGERSGSSDEILRSLCENEETPTICRFREILFKEKLIWRTEERPDLALATLTLVFGEQTVRSWILNPTADTTRPIVQKVFGGETGKFQHAARNLGLIAMEELRGKKHAGIQT